jgi:hypothetical protein
VAHVVVAGTLLIARFEVNHFHIADAKAKTVVHQGLLSFDATWYEAIARSGYRGAGHESLRFFPGLPITARFLHTLTAIPIGALLLMIAAVGSFAATMVIYWIAKSELGETVVANRATWVFNLAPSAFVLLMGYSEPLFILLCLGCFFCLRRDRWLWAASFGYLAALTRPFGLLLALPALIEGLRGSGLVKQLGPSRISLPQLASRGLAVVAPIAGMVTYLGWVAASFHDFFAPFNIQLDPQLHGHLGNPIVVLWNDSVDAVRGHHLFVSSLLSVIAIAAVLLVVTLRKLPVSYGLFALAVVLAAVSGHNLNSIPRYVWSAFPLVIGAATLLRSWRVALPAFSLCVAGLIGLTLVSFQGAYTP